MVHQAARCGHHDLTACLQLALLFVQPGAAVDADDLDVGQKLRQILQVLGDLLGQFPGGAQHHGLGFQAGRVDLGKNGDAEGHRLAGAGGSLGDHIVAAHHQRNGFFLDFGHFGKAHGLGGADDFGRNMGKLGKLHSVCTAFRAFYGFLLL